MVKMTSRAIDVNTASTAKMDEKNCDCKDQVITLVTSMARNNQDSFMCNSENIINNDAGGISCCKFCLIIDCPPSLRNRSPVN
eukprot:scaffold309947_cov19-Prasinocladus_malaysianus.AAC.1